MFVLTKALYLDFFPFFFFLTNPHQCFFLSLIVLHQNLQWLNFWRPSIIWFLILSEENNLLNTRSCHICSNASSSFFPVTDLTHCVVLSQSMWVVLSFECFLNIVTANAISTILLLYEFVVFPQSWFQIFVSVRESVCGCISIFFFFF